MERQRGSLDNDVRGSTRAFSAAHHEDNSIHLILSHIAKRCESKGLAEKISLIK
jgi:hypothetical protein